MLKISPIDITVFTKIGELRFNLSLEQLEHTKKVFDILTTVVFDNGKTKIYSFDHAIEEIAKRAYEAGMKAKAKQIRIAIGIKDTL